MSSQDRTHRIVYKILAREEWDAAVARGGYAGSADDLRDGFVHLSAATQLFGTAAKYFRGQDGLVLVAFDAVELGGSLKWEPSRGGELFPHLFCELPAKCARQVYDLPLGDDGIPLIPEGLE